MVHATVARALKPRRRLFNMKKFVDNRNDQDDVVHVNNNQQSSFTQLIDMTAEMDESVFVCDLSDIIFKHKNWLTKMPRVEPHFAVKANQHPTLLKLLAKLGAGFDCASKGEIEAVLKLDVAPERIIFANPSKHPSHIRFAKEHQVPLMTFDCEAELHKINGIYPDARLVLRIKCDANDARIALGQKFGCEPSDANRLLCLAKRLNLNVIGLSFHVGTEVRDATCYGTAIYVCRKIADDAKRLGYDFELIDIGGGYEGAKGTTIQSIANVVNESLDRYFPEPNVKIIAEPGRYYVDSAFTLVCKVISIREMRLSERESERIKYMYYINDSIYKNFNSVVTEMRHYKPKLIRSDENDDEKCLSTIWGQTCDSIDLIVSSDWLPKLKMYDRLVFDNMGAYTLCLNSWFNGFQNSYVHNIINWNDRAYVEGLFKIIE